jgi:hypothetical protein
MDGNTDFLGIRPELLDRAALDARFRKLNSHAWGDYIPPPMGQGETEAFQKALDEMAGVEPDGSPRLWLVWAPDYEEWSVYHKRMLPAQWAFWRAVRDGVEPECEGSLILRPKWRYVAVPRYAILGRIPPESRWGDTRDRTIWEPDGTSVEELEQPRAWKKLVIIWTHDERQIGGMPLCCYGRAHEHKTKCFGEFRKPDNYDLKWIGEKLALSKKLFQAAPHERLTAKDRANVASGRIDELAAEQAARDREADYISKQEDNNDWYKRPNDSVKGKYSIPGV